MKYNFNSLVLFVQFGDDGAKYPFLLQVNFISEWELPFIPKPLLHQKVASNPGITLEIPVINKPFGNVIVLQKGSTDYVKIKS